MEDVNLKDVFAKSPMKPVLVVPPDTVSDADLQSLRDNSFCPIVAKEPNAVRFLDPIPAVGSRDHIEQAAIVFSRAVLDPTRFKSADGQPAALINRTTLVSLFLDIMVKGTALNPGPTQAEQDKVIYDRHHADEVARIAREDARAEAAARKAEKARQAESRKSGSK